MKTRLESYSKTITELHEISVKRIANERKLKTTIVWLSVAWVVIACYTVILFTELS